MEKFNFYLDHTVTVWLRTDFEVEAETIFGARRLATSGVYPIKINLFISFFLHIFVSTIKTNKDD